MAANTRAHARLGAQQGYLLLELAITLMLVGVVAIYTRSVALQDMDDVVAVATGTYVLAAAAGLETYVMANTTALMNGQAVTGVVTATAPTLAELKALTVNNSPLLPSTFPSLGPTRQALQFNVQRVVNAGVTELRSTACLTAPLRWRGAYRDDLVTVAMQSMSGRGGRSMTTDNGATVRGPLITAGLLPNPVAGTPVGILCSVNFLSDAFYSAFARQQDSRNLSFSGAVNASGTLNATGTVNATGTLGITTVSAGAACTTAGAIAWVTSGTTHLPARCSGTTWVAMGGLPVVALGAACTVAGALATDTNSGAALVCQGTTYVSLMSRMGVMAAMGSYLVSNSSTVTKPTCAWADATKAIYLFGSADVQGGTQTSQVVVRQATSTSDALWTISISDGSGNAVSGDAIAVTYCVY